MLSLCSIFISFNENPASDSTCDMIALTCLASLRCGLSFGSCCSCGKLSKYAAMLHDFLACGKNGWTWQRKIQHVSNRNPRFLYPHQHLKAFRRCVRRFRPYNLLPIAACNQKESLTDRRRSVITGTEQSVLQRTVKTILRQIASGLYFFARCVNSDFHCL